MSYEYHLFSSSTADQDEQEDNNDNYGTLKTI